MKKAINLEMLIHEMSAVELNYESIRNNTNSRFMKSSSLNSVVREDIVDQMHMEKVKALTEIFKTWNEYEQTVFLYSLVKHITWTQARFLVSLLERELSVCKNMFENNVKDNSSDLLDCDAAHQELLNFSVKTCEPDSNHQTKNVSPSINIDSCSKLSEQSDIEQHDLLTSSLLPEPQAAGNSTSYFTSLQQSKSDLVSSTVSTRSHLPLSATYSAPCPFANDNTCNVKVSRSNSLTPPVIHMGHDSLSYECSPSSASPAGSSGSLVDESDTKNSFLEDASGMRDVPLWLKSLRLHKYAPLFSRLTYEEMLSLREEQLADLGVTKGARHKIVVCILKLNDRPALLRQLEENLNESGMPSLKHVLSELRNILSTPIKPYVATSSQSNVIVDEDLPSLICLVMGKVCTHVLLTCDEDSCSVYLQLLDKCVSHEAFTGPQKKRLLSWKQQCHKLPRCALRKCQQRFPSSVSNMMNRRLSNGNSNGPQRSSSGNNLYSYPQTVNSGSNAIGSHVSLPRNRLLGRANSLYTKQPLSPLSSTVDAEMRGLESLCRSVTEHALGADIGEPFSM